MDECSSKAVSKVYLKRNLRGTPSGTRKRPEGKRGGASQKAKGYSREKESTSPRIDEYFKIQDESIVSLKEEDDTAVAERGVKLSSDDIERGEVGQKESEESKAQEVKKGNEEQRDSVELKPQAKVIKNDDSRLSHEPPGSSKTTTKVSQSLTKTVHKDTKVTSNASGRSKAAGRRKRKTVTTGASDSDFAPHTSGQRRKEVQQTIRDHFPVRRSTRKPKAILESEKFEEIAEKLLSKNESGLKVVEVEGKGRGVVSTRSFVRGELICEYSGELISHEEAKAREERYSEDDSIGCYMYYFEHKGAKLCVDATKDNGRMGRLLNHSKTQANVVTKLYEVKEQPFLCLIAARDIKSGEELQYDYGERSKAAIESHPWLAA